MNTYTEVRKAYRFLHEFHRRLRSNQLKLIKEIDPSFNFLGVQVIYNSRPSFSQRFQENWMSDYFPLLNHRIIFASETSSSLIALDTYIDEGISEHFDTKKNDFLAVNLNPAKESDSFIEVYLYKFEVFPENVLEVYNSSDYCEEYNEVQKMGNNISQYSKRIEIEELENFDSVVVSLSDGYKKLLSSVR